MIKILELKDADYEELESINELLPQLSSSAELLDIQRLKVLINSESTIVYIAQDEHGKILGTLSLVTIEIPTGRKGWIEDVVVDQSARGKGIGKALMNHALEKAVKFGLKSVDLTSRPSREEANMLYQSLGYQKRETNVYRYNFF